MPSKEVEKLDVLTAAGQAEALRKTVDGRTPKTSAAARAWQKEAWELYREVGELRFLANTLAGRIAQARLYVGKNEEQAGAEPTPVTSGLPFELLHALGGGPSGIVRLLKRGGAGLFVAGEATIVGVPTQFLDAAADTGEYTVPTGDAPDPDLDAMEWATLSSEEIAAPRDGKFSALTFRGIKLKDVPESSVHTISLWNPDPADYGEADSPVRSALPVLRELVGLTSHVSAQIDSRLAGAGMLFLPTSMKGQDVHTGLLTAMSTAIGDRAAASAIVPLIVYAGAEEIAAAQHMTFASELDAEARELREEAIRRLALSLDAPPEVLLGTSGANHWGAWLIKEDTVTTHIEPPLALIVEAITTQFLRPVLASQGYPDAERYSVWYDVSDIIESPDRLGDAVQLYDRGAISLKALRAAAGFQEGDAPDARDAREEAIEIVKELVKGAPSLAPSVADLVEQWESILSGQRPDRENEQAVEEAVEDVDGEGSEPEEESTPTDEDAPLPEGPPAGGNPTP